MTANSLPGVILVMSNPQARTEMEEVLVQMEVDVVLLNSVQEAETYWVTHPDMFVMVIGQSIAHPGDGLASAVAMAVAYPDYPFVVLAAGDPRASLGNLVVISKKRGGETAWKDELPKVLEELAFP